MNDDMAIFEALSSPQQIWGCERRWFALSAAVAAMIAGPAGLLTGKLSMFFLGLLVFAVSTALGAYWTEKDPQFRDVYVEAFSYEHAYAATSRWDVAYRPARSWV